MWKFPQGSATFSHFNCINFRFWEEEVKQENCY